LNNHNNELCVELEQTADIGKSKNNANQFVDTSGGIGGNTGINGDNRDVTVNEDNNKGISASSSRFECPKRDAENNPDEVYANPYSCSTFFQCSNGHAYMKDCPDGLQWSSKALRCEWPENSD
ncbi:23201_t:CDS:2, partial [Gigaspora rosea]